MMNPNWPRWIVISILKHIVAQSGLCHNKVAVQPDDLPVYLEDEHRDTDDLSPFVELRISGPDCKQLTRHDWRLFVTINLLLQQTMSDDEWISMRRNMGTVAAALTNVIPIYRTGVGAADDGGLLGCLTQVAGSIIDTTMFGEVNPVNRLQQATIEGRYDMCLVEGDN